MPMMTYTNGYGHLERRGRRVEMRNNLFTGQKAKREKRAFMEFLAEHYPFLYDTALAWAGREVMEGDNVRAVKIVRKVFVRLWREHLSKEMDEDTARLLLKKMGVRYEGPALREIEMLVSEIEARGAGAPGRSRRFGHV